MRCRPGGEDHCQSAKTLHCGLLFGDDALFALAAEALLGWVV